MQTDYERLVELLRKPSCVIGEGREASLESLKVMENILGKNQNGPEHGADGSFTKESWTAANAVVRKLFAAWMAAEGFPS